jgi:hypothetical protein
MATTGFLTITLADDGQTLSISQGTSFLVSLGEAYDWQVQIADPAIVSRVMNIAVPYGAQGVYVAEQVGRTTLGGTGTARGKTASADAGAATRSFRVQLVVT